MKYTNYIINGKIDIQGMVSHKKYLRQATILMAIPVAIFGVVVLSGVLPLAMMADSSRYAKLVYYHRLKVYHKHQYINNILDSLSVQEPYKTKWHIFLNNL